MPAETRRAIARALLATVPMLARAIAASMRDVQERLSPAHFAMLTMLSMRSMTQAELGERMQVGAPTISASVDALEKRGWVQRERAQADRRAVLVILTDVGAAALKAMDDQALAGLEAAADRLTAAEQDALLIGLGLLTRMFAPPDLDAGAPLDEALMPRHPRPFPPPGFPPMGFPPPPPGMMPFNFRLHAAPGEDEDDAV